PEQALYVLGGLLRCLGNGSSKRFQVGVAVHAPRTGVGGRIPLEILAQATSVLPRVSRTILRSALVDGPQRDSRAPLAGDVSIPAGVSRPRPGAGLVRGSGRVYASDTRQGRDRSPSARRDAVVRCHR